MIKLWGRAISSMNGAQVLSLSATKMAEEEERRGGGERRKGETEASISNVVWKL